MRKKIIPYSRQDIGDEDLRAIKEVLRSDFITQGPKIDEFERKLAKYCGAKYAVVFSSGTAALHAAYFVAGISKNTEIITSPITFLSTTNASLFLGALPVFVDIEPDTGNINSELIEKAITEKTRAIIPVDYAGHPADLEKIVQIAEKYNLLVIEDACHALGAEYKGKKIGNCKYSDMVIFSFHPVKSITTGEGGAVLTDNKEYYNQLIIFRHHGIIKGRTKCARIQSENWYYKMVFLGYNYRLTDIQCALGISQLKKIDMFLNKRRKIVEIYNKTFKSNEYFELPVERDYAQSSWHLYPIRLRNKYKNKKREIYKKLREYKLGVQVHYIPVYWHPFYRKLKYQRGICKCAEDFYRREISIPLYPSLGMSEIKYVIDAIFKVFKKYR